MLTNYIFVQKYITTLYLQLEEPQTRNMHSHEFIKILKTKLYFHFLIHAV